MLSLEELENTTEKDLVGIGFPLLDSDLNMTSAEKN
jgi:hypothetical protein